MRHSPSRHAFTLVELAIVLVIIGLLVGGVLVGRDLIHASQVRASIRSIEEFNAATHTFREKYSGLPGDLLSSKAAEFGFEPRTGAAGKGDGDGWIRACSLASNNFRNIGCENILFWRDLSQVGLIKQKFDSANDNIVIDMTSSAEMLDYMPTLPLNDALFVHIATRPDRLHLWYLTIITGVTTGSLISGTTSPGLTTGEAKSIDEKFDDGYPLTGTVTAAGAPNTTNGPVLDTGGSATATRCVVNTVSPEVYNVTTSYVDNLNCRVVIRTGF